MALSGVRKARSTSSAEGMGSEVPKAACTAGAKAFCMRAMKAARSSYATGSRTTQPSWSGILLTDELMVSGEKRVGMGMCCELC